MSCCQGASSTTGTGNSKFLFVSISFSRFSGSLGQEGGVEGTWVGLACSFGVGLACDSAVILFWARGAQFSSDADHFVIKSLLHPCFLAPPPASPNHLYGFFCRSLAFLFPSHFPLRHLACPALPPCCLLPSLLPGVPAALASQPPRGIFK